MASSHSTFTPAGSYEEGLERAARQFGIDTSYWDIFGKQHFTSPGVIASILQSMGFRAESKQDLDALLEDQLWQEWSRLLPPTLVVTAQGEPIEIMVSLPGACGDSLATLEVVWEQGEACHQQTDFSKLPVAATASLRGGDFVRKLLRLPADSPLGYHTAKLWIERGGQPALTAETRLIVCPDRAYQPAILEGEGRAAGVAFHLPGVRSDRNWGCGDFTDLRSLVNWAVDSLGASFVALNPLHAIANRAPYNTSPYLPLSIFYRNWIYIDVESAVDFQAVRQDSRSASCGVEAGSLRQTEFVDYERVSGVKLRYLRFAFYRFLRKEWAKHTERAGEFRVYIQKEGPLLERFALYCALDEYIRGQNPDVWVWTQWPEEYQDPESEACREFARRHARDVMFYQYLQWQAEIQLADAQKYACGKGLAIGLYHDLALATDRYGSDFWGYRDFFVPGCRVGAPPDDFSPNGQDWAFPPPNARHHWETGYELFRDSIRKNCQYGGALRIDHVMRFFRLFWIPEGKQAIDGTYVQDRYEDLVRILALESVRHRVVVVGEDLGTVEPYIRKVLERYGVLSYRLFYFEKHKDGSFRRPKEYPRQALVSSTTHDLPTLAGFWSGRDIEARRQAGVLPEEAVAAAYEDRQKDKQRMLDVLFSLNLLPDSHGREAAKVTELTGELHHAILGFLAQTPSMLMVLNQEDITKEPDQQNLPGTTDQHPNWSRKARYSLEELQSNQLVADCAAMLRDWLGQTRRLQGERVAG